MGARTRNAKHTDEDDTDTLGSSSMTPARISKILDSDRRMYYRTLDLNDRLYIHFQGFRKLAHLEGFTGLKTLYAECNAFEHITGLETCTQLRSLFLQQNCIRDISGLENNKDLWSINLSENWITKIEGIKHLRRLNTLTITKNRIGHNGLQDIMELKDTTIGTLDIQDNGIADPEVLPEVFCKMKELRVLYLKGNPVVKNIPNYRKTVIAMIPELKYLDDRPVFVDDRRYAEAFVRGGLDAERDERKLIKQEKEEASKRNHEAFQKMIAQAKEVRREKEAMRAHDKYTDATDPVETWRQKQDRFVRENPQFDYPDAAERRAKELAAAAKAEAKPEEKAQPDAREKAEIIKEQVEKADVPPPYAPIDWDDDMFGAKAAKDDLFAAGTPVPAKPASAAPAAPALQAAKLAFQPPARKPASQPVAQLPKAAPLPKKAPVPAPGVRIVNELEELD